VLKKLFKNITFSNLGKLLGRITILEIAFWAIPGFCILRAKNLKSLFAVYFLNGRIYFQFFYLKEISVKINKKYAIDIINLIGFIPIAYYYYYNYNSNEIAKYVFYCYLAYFIILFFFTDAKPAASVKEKPLLIKKGQ